MTRFLPVRTPWRKALTACEAGKACCRSAGVILALLLAGCAEPVPELKRDYVGNWRSAEMTLIILADGTVAYERFKKGGNVSINAPIKEFRGDDFVVGVSFFTTTFEVSEPPHEVNGQWQMVVDGVRLTRTTPGGSGPLRPAFLGNSLPLSG